MKTETRELNIKPTEALEQVWQDMREAIKGTDAPCAIYFNSNGPPEDDNEFATKLYALMLQFKVKQCAGVLSTVAEVTPNTVRAPDNRDDN